MESVSLLLSGLKGWVPPVVSVLLIPLLLHLISKIQENGKADADRATEIKRYLHEQMAALEEKVGEQFETIRKEIERRIDNHEKRLSILERDAVMKEEFYQATNGWRTEINRLSDLITQQMARVMENIIGIWKEKK